MYHLIVATLIVLAIAPFFFNFTSAGPESIGFGKCSYHPDFIMESYNQVYIENDIGAEFYVTAGSLVGVPTHVRGGTYMVEWYKTNDGGNNASITITPQYACGIGAIERPMKDDWNDGRSLLPYTKINFPSLYVLDYKPLPYTKPFLLPGDSDIFALGDSLVEQFLQGGRSTARFRKVQAPLTTETLGPHFITPLAQLMTGPRSTNSVLILNSGVWDVLDEQSLGIEDHVNATKQLLDFVTERYPDVSVIWKSMTAMHIHRTTCKRSPWCNKRVKYMSNSMAKKVYAEQRRLLSEHFTKSVFFMDQYLLTYLNADETIPNDGRHYTREFNERLWATYMQTDFKN